MIIYKLMIVVRIMLCDATYKLLKMFLVTFVIGIYYIKHVPFKVTSFKEPVYLIVFPILLLFA